MNQNQQILTHLKTGKGITPMEALREYGCFRLAGRVYDLRLDGWPIVCDRLDVGDGKRVGHYYLVNDKDQWPTQ